MKTSFLKRLDSFLSPAACAISALRPKSGRAGDERALVIRPGGMGDLICADIALGELGLDARAFMWAIERRSEPWASYRELPHACYDGDPIRSASELRDRYALVINTEQFFGLAQAYALMAQAKGGKVVSFQTNRRAGWANRTVSYDWRDQHETIEFARVFSAALSLPAPTEARLARPRLRPAGEPPLVLMAGRQSPSRNLDLESWVILIKAWRNDGAFQIAASPEDAGFADELALHFDGRADRFTGSFAELCERISRCEEILTMDGGGAHIASYFGVPTLAVFTSGRDRKWQPLGAGSRILRRHDLPCQPCTKFGQVPPCPFHYACRRVEGLKPEPLG